MLSLVSRSRVQSLADPATTFRWNFALVGNNLNILDPIYVLTANIPLYTVQPYSVRRGSLHYNFAGQISLPSLGLTFYETKDYYVLSWLRNWQKQVADKNGQGLPSDYMNTAELIAYDTMGLPAISITLDGLWPIGPDNLQYNQSSQALELSWNFSVNEVSIVTAYTMENDLLDALGIFSNPISGLLGSAGNSILSSLF